MENHNSRTNSKIQNPHDRFFKETWTDPEVAKDFLQTYLPQGILSAIDLDTLEICRDSFVTEELSEYFSDIFYRVEAGQKTGFIYFLFEHKSYPDGGIRLQLLGYMLEIWRQYRKEIRSGKLPPVVPLVMYHNEKEWVVDTSFSSAVYIPNESFLEFIPDFRFILYDLSRYSDEEIRGEVLLKVALLIMKHISDRELAPKLPGIFELLAELLAKDTGLKYLETLLKYILSGTEYVDEKDLASALRQVAGQSGEEMAMTAAERLVQMGKEQGIEQGLQQGMIQGSVKSLAEGLELAISIKFGETDETRTVMDIIKTINDPARLRQIMNVVKNIPDIKELKAGLLS